MNAEQVFYRSNGANLSKSTKKSGAQWSSNDVHLLKQLVKGNTPTGVMSIELGRTEDAIRAKSSKLGVSLKPMNQTPYNRRKKIDIPRLTTRSIQVLKRYYLKRY